MNKRVIRICIWHFGQQNRKTQHLYSLLSLCKWNDYYLHCDSKCSCYLSLQFDLLTEERALYLCSSEVPSCSLLFCGMISPSRNHCSQSMLMILSTAVFHFLQYKFILFHFCVPSFTLRTYSFNNLSVNIYRWFHENGVIFFFLFFFCQSAEQFC